MKKIIGLLFVVCITAFAAQAQSDCLNAKKYNVDGSGYDTIPPVGTPAISGPDYGCLQLTGRQIWYYLPICNTGRIRNIGISAVTIAVNPMGDQAGAILYGPFTQKVTDCADLNASKIIHCSTATNFNSFDFDVDFNFTDTLYAGNYYYLAFTFNDSLTGNAFYHNDGPTFLTDNCFECNNQVSVVSGGATCLVTVDTAINKCVINWEEVPGQNLWGYNIYCETTLTGLYDSIAAVPLASLSTYTDMNSSPAQHNYRYGVRAVDSCGNSYAQSVDWYAGGFLPLSSIHLICSPGGNNVSNLIWNNVYTTNTVYVPQYYIYRNTNGAGWQVIDSIGITLPTITYTDIFAPAGSNEYTVELRKVTPCVPMRTVSTAYQSVFSNNSSVIVTGINTFENNNAIALYPNFTKDNFSISCKFDKPENITVQLFNLYGQQLATLFEGRINPGKQDMVFSAAILPAGTYVVRISTESGEVVKKIMKL